MADFPASGSPPMIGRVLNAAEWRDYVADYDFGTIPPTRLVLHHTYRPTEAQWRGLASMRGMQRYYASLGWSSAPHIYAAPDGIWLFTPMRDVGIHAGLGNQGWSNGVWWYSIGLEMVGYFDFARPDGAVWDFARMVMGTLSRRLAIAPRQLISFHRDYTNQKSCPGWTVTKDWVFAEVEAWLNDNPPSESNAAGSIGRPTPTDEVVLDRLANESYSRRATSYHVGWAFHQYAIQENQGAPLAASRRISVDGKDYSYQPFARDTLYSEVPNWGQVNLLSELLGGSIPPSGLGRVLLEASYRDSGATFRADWAFHQYALAAGLGPALTPSTMITVDGTAYAFQVFARDTLYSPVPNWSDVRELSRLRPTTDPAQAQLRNALLAQTYQQAGTSYQPGWSFHQLAQQWDIGSPLSGDYKIDIEGVVYNIQVYALDTLYNIVPQWTDVQRMSQLVAKLVEPQPRPGSSFSRRPLAEMVLEPGTTWEPPDQSVVLHYTHTPPPSSFSSREDTPVQLIVLHGDPGPARATLERMAELGAPHSTHYYLTREGTIYQVIHEAFAAWHAGMALYSGSKQHINQMSIGVVLERPLDLAPNSSQQEAQRQALGWLVRDIASRYTLSPGAVVRWRDLAPGSVFEHSRQPLDDITLELLFGW